jgi:hypothetical protein
MWALKWGQMLWGQTTSVPSLWFWGAAILSAALLLIGVSVLRKGRPRTMGIAALVVGLLVPLSVEAVPFTFSNGTVADANQVNANFAAVQGVGPKSSDQLVDLVAGSPPCPTDIPGDPTGAIALDFRVSKAGNTDAFQVPLGQVLVLSQVNVDLQLGASSAGHTFDITFIRATNIVPGPNSASRIARQSVTLDSHGTGTLTLPLGFGSAFQRGTVLCVSGRDVVSGDYVGDLLFASAHGYLTSD